MSIVPTLDQVDLKFWEMTQTDGFGFSLCAAPLDIVRSCISEYIELEPQKVSVRQAGERRSSVFRTRVGRGQRG